jgi:hypothetical protein
MRVRVINIEEDYPMLADWWIRRGIQAPQKEIFPLGVLAHEGDFPVACAFLYEDTRGVVGMVEWEATNPDCHSAMQALRGLNMLFDFFEKYWCIGPHRLLLSWVTQGRGDGRILDRRGWKKCPGERHELMAFSTLAKEAEPCLR